MFCYVPSKSTYNRYWNLIPLSGRQYRKKNIEAIEKVQRRFTKRLFGLRDYSYSERPQMLYLQSLELRRIHYDFTWTYQIVFGLTVLNVKNSSN